MTNGQEIGLRIIQGRLEGLAECSELTNEQHTFLLDTAEMICDLIDHGVLMEGYKDD